MDLSGLRPARTIAPRTAEEVATAIGEANVDAGGIVLWGGGSRIEVGDAPSRYDVALDLRELAGVIAHEPGDLVATVGAGTTLGALDHALAPHGQRWPVEAGLPDRATVGGTIAGAAHGPSRMRYFHPRDWTIGVRAVLGEGTLTRAGGRVVKNVTGYDLTRLYSGSYGTLCALVEVTLKLAPRPARTLALRADLASAAEAIRAGQALYASRLPLDALAVTNGDAARALGASGDGAVVVRLAGTEAAVARLASALPSALSWTEVAGELWTRIASLPCERDWVARASWPAGQALEQSAAEDGAIVYPGSGTAYLLRRLSADAFAALRRSLEDRDGALVLERADAQYRRAVGTWGTSRAPSPIARALKARFDPRGVLAPGRLPA